MATSDCAATIGEQRLASSMTATTLAKARFRNFRGLVRVMLKGLAESLHGNTHKRVGWCG
jgi:hypothetical protein